MAARALPRALVEAAQAIRDGGDVDAALTQARQTLAAAGFGPIDYVELCDPETLRPMGVLNRPARLLAAAKLGRRG
jgi:pantoate--beta-alanine ligase